MFNKNVYISRRDKLKKLVKNGLIIIVGNSESPMSYSDNAYNFIQDSTFLYYFGLNSPDLIGVIDIENNQEYIFGKEFTIDDIIWMGQQKTFKERSLEVGIENFVELQNLEKLIENVKNNNVNIHFTNQYRVENALKLSKLLNVELSKINTDFSEELVKAIIEMRNIKEECEIMELEKATNVTREMHLTAMRNVKPGMKGYELVALLECEAKKYNATTSFHTICTTNGQILHNHFHGNEFKDGDIVLLDCGARLENGYCGDMTTVFPVSGKFDERQKDIYSLLIEMFEKAEECTKPRVTNKSVHLEVCKVLAKGLVKRGILKGEIDEIVKNGAHALFFPHGLGHMIGLDVHDMENFGEEKVGYDENTKRETQFGLKSLRMGKELKPGYVLTIEPGIYFIPELIEKWEKEGKFKEYINYEMVKTYLDFGGMRYEGDFLITENGSRRLGNKMPKYFNEVEKEIV
ncbi:aminopeptidase P family protein [Candidatus Cetobacterium colombiensis]|uniref:Xaa-Pro aminopeptidase n=1 Tax=Candidatus Cetobacterium colombiensis TaxID=3073100 RepID=A0ABU4W6C9_9FUSO|nr:aminopeptidase P family protein [Candidatus Cetobacterium colombiensis]MDX8335081.1 aminopeptidase P family protein [Candidatus Cetobacterium colombiensis]